MAELPDIGAVVALRGLDGVTYPSRVEDYDESTYTVARPASLLAGRSYDAGLEMDLTWTAENGIFKVPVVLVGSHSEGYVRLWDLSIEGDIVSEQRREYVRVPLGGPISIRPQQQADASAGARDDDDEPLGGTLVDISESAVHFAVKCDLDDPRVRVGSQVQCEFAWDSEAFSIPGVIRLVRPSGLDREQHIVAEFVAREGLRETIRKHIFSVQVAIRRQQRE